MGNRRGTYLGAPGSLALIVGVIAATVIASGRGNAGTTAPDLTQLEELTNQYLTGIYAIPAQPQIVQYGNDYNVAPVWALVDWKAGPSGGELAATKSKSGTWSTKFASGGAYNTQELINRGVPSAVGTYLKANMKPLPAPPPDLIQIEELTNKKLTGVYRVPAQPQITYYAIDLNSSPPYALVEWVGYRFAGGEFVATKSKSGIWSLTFGSGGLYSTQELIDYGVPSAVATYLEANMKRLPTATQSDLVQLEELTNQLITTVYAVPAQRQIAYYAIDSNSSPPYALVDWGDNKHAGGEFVATKGKNGVWSLTFGSGGLYSTQELIDYGVPSAVATYLKANMKPLPTPTP